MEPDGVLTMMGEADAGVRLLMLLMPMLAMAAQCVDESFQGRARKITRRG
jgi:hypothetical protein